MKRPPFFSVVVVCLNAEQSIGGTLDSILSQSYGDYEIIIKDGMSNDSTLKKVPQDERIKVYQSPDRGIYDAMNQATVYIQGEYVVYMNCGDRFYNNEVLAKVKDAIGDTKRSCFYGDMFRDGEVRNQSANITDFSLYRSSICHQSIFFASDLLRKENIYDTKYRVCADHELEICLKKDGVAFRYLGIVICKYEGQGFSETGKGAVLLKKEKKAIRKAHFTPCQRFIFEARYQMTFPWLRKVFYSQNSPAFIKKVYRKLVNFYYKKSN